MLKNQIVRIFIHFYYLLGTKNPGKILEMYAIQMNRS
jgi:hypothetical protein